MDELELIIGARVYCKNGKCGRLTKVAVEPQSGRVTHIIVEDGFLQRHSRAFPISAVAQATTGDIYLELAEDDLGRYPQYQEEIVERPASGDDDGAKAGNGNGTKRGDIFMPPDPMVRHKVRQGISPELTVVERGTPIINLKGAVGRLDYLLVNPQDGQILGLVMQQRTIPTSVVQSIDENGISVA